MDTNKHQISNARSKQLRTVLYENGISADDFLLDKTPMKMLDLYEPQVDRLSIVEAMLKEESYEIETGELTEKYKTTNQEITFYEGTYKGTVSYKGYNEKYTPSKFTKDEVIEVGKKFAADFTLNQMDFQLITIKHEIYENYYILEFNGVYGEDILFCSYVRIKVTEEGVEEGKAEIYTPIDYEGAVNAVYPIDEVLYKFISEVDLSNNEMVRITDLQIGYDVVIDDIKGDLFADAIPYYRITINNEDVYYIDAYTNELVIFD
jgi:hypothetical protein